MLAEDHSRARQLLKAKFPHPRQRVEIINGAVHTDQVQRTNSPSLSLPQSLHLQPCNQDGEQQLVQGPFLCRQIALRHCPNFIPWPDTRRSHSIHSCSAQPLMARSSSLPPLTKGDFARSTWTALRCPASTQLPMGSFLAQGKGEVSAGARRVCRQFLPNGSLP